MLPVTTLVTGIVALTPHFFNVTSRYLVGGFEVQQVPVYSLQLLIFLQNSSTELDTSRRTAIRGRKLQVRKAAMYAPRLNASTGTVRVEHREHRDRPVQGLQW